MTTPITLSPEQFHAVASGGDIRFTMNGVECVIVRSEVFDHAQAVANADHEELRAMLARSSEGNGWDEPGMEAYNSYLMRVV